MQRSRIRQSQDSRGGGAPAQVSKLVRAADGDWRGATLLGYYTGARLGDVANMRWEAIDWPNKVIRFTPSKTKKPVAIPLHRDLERELLKNAGIGRAALFPSLAGKGTGGKHGLSGRFAAIMEKAGIEGKRTQASGGRRLSSLSFHSLRHSFKQRNGKRWHITRSPAETHRPHIGGNEQGLHASRA